MSVDNQTCRDEHIGDDVATEFPVTFPFLDNVHLVVTRIEVGGTETPLVLDTTFTATGEGLPAGYGEVTISSPLLTGETLVVERVLPPDQPVDIANLSEGYQEVIEEGLDRLAMKGQEIERVLGLHDHDNARVPKLGHNEVDGSGSYDARDNKIANLADGVDPGDAVNFSQISGISGVLVIVTALPSADSTWYGKSVLVKYPAGPSAAFWCGLQSDGTTYEWVSFGTTSA